MDQIKGFLEAAAQEKINLHSELGKTKRSDRESKRMLRQLVVQRAQTGVGNGRNSVSKRGQLKGGLHKVVKKRFLLNFLTALTVLPPDGWLLWDGNNGNRYCWIIMQALGFAGHEREEIPEPYTGRPEAFFLTYTGYFNKDRQDFVLNSLKRLNTLKKAMLKGMSLMTSYAHLRVSYRCFCFKS